MRYIIQWKQKYRRPIHCTMVDVKCSYYGYFLKYDEENIMRDTYHMATPQKGDLWFLNLAASSTVWK